MAPIDTSFLKPFFQKIVASCPEAIDFDKVTAAQARIGASKVVQPDIKMPPVDIEKIEIPDQGDGHLIKVTLYKPKDIPADAKLPALVYFPGGGFCIIHEPNFVYLISTFAVDLGCIVAFVNYSLSPEVQFPVALHEGYSVVEYLTNTKTASKLHIDPKRVAVGGDSAGGNLSAGISLLAKQRNQLEHPIKYQVLYYPCVDNDVNNESYTKFSEGFLFTKKMANYFLKKYAPDDELENICLFPNKASIEELVGLPPVLLITCEADILCEEGEAYGHKLNAANVPVSSYRVQGVIHGFLSSPASFSEESYHVIDITKNVLQKAFSNTVNN